MMMVVNGILYSDEDLLIRKAEFERKTDNVRDITNVVLYSGLAYAIASGFIGTVFLGEMIAITVINKSVKYGLKKSGLDQKLYNMIKGKRVVESV